MTDSSTPPRQWFARGDQAMAYWRCGTPGAATFVLVHGIGMGHLVFDGLGELLAPHGEVVLVDLPGFGDSPEPEEPRDIPASGAFLAEFVGSLGVPNPVLVGHSMGSQIVAEAAAQAPESVSSIVLVSPTVDPAAKSPLQQARRLALDLLDESTRVLWLGFRYYLEAGPRWMVRKLRTMIAHDMPGILPRVPVPALVLRGERDRVSPDGWSRFIAQALPRGSYRELAGCGHEAMLRNSEQTTAEILAHVRRVDAET